MFSFNHKPKKIYQKIQKRSDSKITDKVEIIKKLNDAIFVRFGIDPTILFNFGTVVIGSFCVSVLNNVQWEESDIDIVIIVSNYTDSHPLYDYITNVLGGVLSNIESSLKRSHLFTTTSGGINVIPILKKTLRNQSIYDYIMSISDINVCASVFDGYTLTHVGDIFSKNAYVINTHLIDKKDCDNINSDIDAFFGTKKIPKNTLLKRLFRIIKYQKRGFIISGTEKMLSYIKPKKINSLTAAYLEYNNLLAIYVDNNYKRIFKIMVDITCSNASHSDKRIVYTYNVQQIWQEFFDECGELNGLNIDKVLF